MQFTSLIPARVGALTLTLAAAASLVLVAACSAPDKPIATSTAAPAATTPAATATPAPTPAGTEVVKVATLGTLGMGLTDVSGKTLYTFATDVVGSGKSACNGTCATTWPPVAAPAGDVAKPTGATGAFSVITRDDGSKQLAYAGRPLYRFAGDAAAGDTKGQGLASGAWTVALAAPPAAGAATPAAGAATGTPAATGTAKPTAVIPGY